jgi:hypothetical protein
MVVSVDEIPILYSPIFNEDRASNTFNIPLFAMWSNEGWNLERVSIFAYL